MKKTKLVILFLHFALAFNCQTFTAVTLKFEPTFGSTKLLLKDTNYYDKQLGTIKIETLKLYISNIYFLKEGRNVFKETNSFHLLDASDSNSMTIKMKVPKEIRYDKFKFDLGIDSVTNNSGAMGGALDPSRGMYWTWQSGYINFKLEGVCTECKTWKNEFQLHLGGYQAEDNALRSVEFLCHQAESYTIYYDLKEFILQANLLTNPQIMSPGPKAVKLSELITKCLSFNKK